MDRISEVVRYLTPNGALHETRAAAERELAVIDVVDMVDRLGLGRIKDTPDAIARTLMAHAHMVVERLQAYLDSRPS